jgi:hypothetical protein
MNTDLHGLLNFLKDYKDAFAAIQSLGTVVAVVIGGWWAWMTFRRRRLRFPRANIRHAICAWQACPKSWHLHVTVSIRNEGEVLLRVDKGCTWAQLIDPYPDEVLALINSRKDPVAFDATEVEWPLIGAKRVFDLVPAHEIEPGESDEFHSDIFP